MNSAAALGLLRNSDGAALVLDQRTNGERMQFEIAVARHLKDAQHLERLASNSRPAPPSAALGQHKAAFQ